MSGYRRTFKYTVKLSCGCFDLDARKDGRKYCRFHGYGTIVGYYAQEWHAKCTTSCRYSAWTGQDKRGAERAAASHMRHKPDHRVAVLYDYLATPEKVAVLRRIMYPELVNQPPANPFENWGPPPF